MLSRHFVGNKTHDTIGPWPPSAHCGQHLLHGWWSGVRVQTLCLARLRQSHQGTRAQRVGDRLSCQSRKFHDPWHLPKPQSRSCLNCVLDRAPFLGSCSASYVRPIDTLLARQGGYLWWSHHWQNQSMPAFCQKPPNGASLSRAKRGRLGRAYEGPSGPIRTGH